MIESYNIGYRYSAGIKKKSVFLISARKRQVLNFLFHAETAQKHSKQQKI